MPKPLFKITSQVAFFEHICEVKTCQCNQDPFVVAFKNKWLVEVQIKKFNGGVIDDPIISGPYDSQKEAEIAMEDIKHNMQIQLNQQGLYTKERPNLRLVH